MTKKIYFAVILLIVLLPVLTLFRALPAKAAPTLIISPESTDTSTSTKYCVGWDSLDLNAATDSLIISFQGKCIGGTNNGTNCLDNSVCTGGGTCDVFDISALASEEIYFYLDSNDCTGTARQGEVNNDDGDDRDLIWPGLQPSSIHINIENDEGVIVNGTGISMYINPAAGNAIVTPANADNYLLTVAQIIDGTSPLEIDWFNNGLLYIGGANEAEITAEVDPTLTLSLSDTTCDLGTFSSSKIVTCGYNAIVSTNATNGYAAYINEDADLINAAADVITDVAASESVTPGGDTAPVDEQYGISTSKSGQTITENTTGASCANLDIGGTEDGDTAMPATSLAASDQKFASGTGPVSADSTEICHAAAIIGSTPAGVYAHTVTITVVGNF